MRIIKCRKVGGEPRLGRKALSDVHDVLASDGLIAYPTETVYGIGADPFSEEAVRRVFRAKRRKTDVPISMAVPSVEALWFYGVIDERSKRFCEKHMPGPVTVLLRATSLAPPSLISKGRIVGLRVPDHPVAIQVLRAFAPLTATSANRHGQPPSTSCDEAVRQLGEDIDVYIDAGPCAIGSESTVVDISEGQTRVIRRGALSEEDL